MSMRAMHCSAGLGQGQRGERTGPGQSRTTDLGRRKTGKTEEATRRIARALPVPMAKRNVEGGEARA
jgi:hypothetical protein